MCYCSSLFVSTCVFWVDQQNIGLKGFGIVQSAPAAGTQAAPLPGNCQRAMAGMSQPVDPSNAAMRTGKAVADALSSIHDLKVKATMFFFVCTQNV